MFNIGFSTASRSGPGIFFYSGLFFRFLFGGNSLIAGGSWK
jgi:hypothetical protein